MAKKGSVEMGKTYREPTNGFEGTVVAITEFDKGQRRITLAGEDAMGWPVRYEFDENQLVAVK
jgi:hypothetical protein